VEQFVEFVGNHYILSSIWVGLALAIIYSFIKQLSSPIKYMTPQLVTQTINRQDGVVVDIRAKAEFDKGHIAGAENLPLEKIQKNDLSSLEKRKSKPIIVVCNAGLSATGAANILLKNGFAEVSVLQGGMNTWLQANLPVSKKK
jgi:rhodanese-related sulfurtransferase